jgi:predicted Zn-dependent peptidase
MTCYSDTGCWSVYFGCDPDDVDECRRLVHLEMLNMTEQPLTGEQLRAAKQQLKGQLAIACDNREQFALDFGKSYLHNGRERDLDRLMAQIDAITADSALSVARQVFDAGGLITLVYE